MLSAYRVVDATDHRGQIAGMILAGLGAEVVARRAARRQPGTAGAATASSGGRTTGASTASCARRDDDVLELVRDADVLLDSGAAFDRDERGRRQPGRSSTCRSAPSAATARRPTGRRRTSRSSPPAAPRRSTATATGRRCARRCPQAWLHAGAEARRRRPARRSPSGSRSGRGQHVDVSAQQAVMQAGIPGVLLAPERQPRGSSAPPAASSPARSTSSSCTRRSTATSRSRCCSAR